MYCFQCRVLPKREEKARNWFRSWAQGVGDSGESHCQQNLKRHCQWQTAVSASVQVVKFAFSGTSPDKYNQLKDFGCCAVHTASAGHDDDDQVKVTLRGFDTPRLKMIMTFNLLNQKICAYI